MLSVRNEYIRAVESDSLQGLVERKRSLRAKIRRIERLQEIGAVTLHRTGAALQRLEIVNAELKRRLRNGWSLKEKDNDR